MFPGQILYVCYGEGIGRILSVSHHMRNIQCSGLTVFCASPDLAIML